MPAKNGDSIPKTKSKLRVSIVLNIVLAFTLLVFGWYKLEPIMNRALGGGYDYESNQLYPQYTSIFEGAVQMQRCDICFVGDSLTSGGLWSEFFPQFLVANRGIGSDTSEGVLNRLNTIVSLEPDKVVLMIGINDLGQGFSVDEISKNVAEIVDRLYRELPQVEIVLQGVLPAKGASEPQILELNKMYSKIADERSNVVYVDFHDAFLSSDGNRNDLFYALDGVHLTGFGYSVWINSIEPFLQ